MMIFFFVLVVRVAAQLAPDQYSALGALLTGLRCTPPRCPEFGLASPCPFLSPPDSLVCANGLVVAIDLRGDLAGSIRGPALSLLTGLTDLQLSGHTLTTVPTQIGRLTALTKLNLERSALTGPVPSGVSELINLATLTLHSNQLTGTLPALDKLTKLVQLDTNSNAGLGGDIPAMPTSIRDLLVQNCSFTALPPNLSALTALADLRVHQNKLSGTLTLPTSLPSCVLQRSNAAETNCIECGAFDTGLCACFSKSSRCSSPTTSTTTFVPLTTSNATTSAATTATAANLSDVTSMLLSTTASTITPSTAPTATVSNVASVLLSTTASMITASAALEPWIVGVIVGGAALALLLVGVAIGYSIKRRARAQEAPDDNPSAAEMKQQSNYNYAAIDVAARNYDQGRLDGNDENDDDQQPAQSNYAVIPGPAKSARARDYDSGRVDGAAAASDYAVGRLN
jgi:hypothetical protein